MRRAASCWSVFLATWLSLPIIALAMVALPMVARADDTDRLATATSLFEEGQRLVQADRASEACPMFEESYRLEPANGTLINLADCYERVGKTASAWLRFKESAEKSARDGQDERALVARQRVDALEPRLTRLRIVVTAEVAGLVVERDGVPLTATTRSIAVPIDPGPHDVRAHAPGYKAWERRFEATGEGRTIELALPALEPLSRAPRPVPVEPTKGDDAPSLLQRDLGIATLVVGSIAAVVGVSLGVAAKARADAADCDGDNFCSQDGLSERDAAVTLGNVGTGVGIAGAVVAGVGLTVWLTAPDEDTSVALRLGPAQLGVHLVHW